MSFRTFAATPMAFLTVALLCSASACPSRNHAPESTRDFYRTDAGNPLIVFSAQGILSNDTDPDEDPLAAVLVKAPRHGELVLGTNGEFTYTPRRKFFGLDTFEYQATDGIARSAPVKVYLAVHARCRVDVLNFGPYVDNNIPGDEITPERIFELLAAVAPFTKGIRTYGTADGLEVIAPMAREMGFEFIALGAFVGDSMTANEEQIENLIAAAMAGAADMLIVGNEALGHVSEETLLGYIQQVKSAVEEADSTIPVAYSDDVDVLLAYPNLIAQCDVICVNVYPFWRRVTNDIAVAYLHCCYSELFDIANGKEIVIAETGWPHEGREDADPELAARYLRNVMGWAGATGVRVFYFEAFDEPWKQAVTGNPIEAHWGIVKPNGRPFPWAKRVFRCKPVDDTWSAFCGPGEIELFITYVPVCGDASDQEITGMVSHAPVGAYKIAAYIRVDGRWYSKPALDAPYTALRCGGAWDVNAGTGPGDEMATDIAIFVVPADFEEPAVNWAEQLPDAVFDAAVDYEIVARCVALL